MKRINLTQHKATVEQGCVKRSSEVASNVKKLLTFVELPTQDEVINRAMALAEVARRQQATEALIGGAPYLTLFLDPLLRQVGIKPLYAFSKRESKEVELDGRVRKISVFKHLGFVNIE